MGPQNSRIPTTPATKSQQNGFFILWGIIQESGNNSPVRERRGPAHDSDDSKTCVGSSHLRLSRLLFLIAESSGDTFLSDDFENDGTLNGQSPSIGGKWKRVSGTVNQIQVVDNRVRLSDANTEDVTSLFDDDVDEGKLYYAFNVIVTDRVYQARTPNILLTGNQMKKVISH